MTWLRASRREERGILAPFIASLGSRERRPPERRENQSYERRRNRKRRMGAPDVVSLARLTKPPRPELRGRRSPGTLPGPARPDGHRRGHSRLLRTRRSPRG